MLKPLMITVVLLCTHEAVQAQAKSPAAWSLRCEAVEENVYDLYLVCKIAPNWEVFAMDCVYDTIKPLRAGVFPYDSNVSPVGDLRIVTKATKSVSPMFGVKLPVHRDEIQLVQRVRHINPKKPGLVRCEVTFSAASSVSILPASSVCFSYQIGTTRLIREECTGD